MTTRILLVEDDDATRYAVAQMLAGDGFDVVQAPDYRDALTVVEDGRPLDLLLTDLVLPGVNGFALARMARMRHLALKVVYVTAHDDIPTHEAMGPIIHKPIEPEALLKVVQDALRPA
jgi:CheY-like chemotaxis protein